MKRLFSFALGILTLSIFGYFLLGAEQTQAARNDIAAPTLSSPADGASAAAPVTFQWSTVTFPGGLSGGYVLELTGQNLDFATRMHWASTNSFAIGNVLLVGTEYSWRVRACLGFSVPVQGVESQCGPWSNNGTFWKFTAVLAKPKLISPANTTKEPIPPSVTLLWEGVLGADTYNVEVRNLTEPFTRTFGKLDGLVGTSFIISSKNFPLNFNHSFQWKVVPLQGAKQGPVSDTWEFFVALPKPTLLTPKNGIDVSYQFPTPASPFTWGSVPGATTQTSYVLEVFDASNIRVAKETLTQTSFSAPIVAINKIGEKYTWQVTACENTNVNCGPPSSRSNFTLVFARPEIVSPKGDVISVAPHTFRWKSSSLPFSGFLSPIYLWEIKGPTSISGKYTEIPKDEEVLMKIDRELLPGNYTWRVRGCSQNETGCSAWSEEATFQVPSPTLIISPPSADILVRGGLQFQALFDPNGPAGLQLGDNKAREARWSSSDPSVANFVDPNFIGTAICQKKGSTNIQAIFQGISAKATLNCTVFEAPIIVSPGLNETIPLPFTFTWNKPAMPAGFAADQIVKYSWKISGSILSTPFSGATTDEFLQVAQSQQQLTPGSYKFEVAASSSNDRGQSVPATVNFVVEEAAGPPTAQELLFPLTAPSLISPANNAKDATTALPLTLTWNTVDFEGLKGGYTVELFESGNETGNPIQHDAWIKSDKHSLDNLSIPPLKIGVTYSWRVRACLGDVEPTSICSNWGSGTTSFWKFTPTLAKPVLSLPTDKSSTFLEQNPSASSVQKSVHLKWNAVVGAASYTVSLRKLTDPLAKDFVAETNDAWIDPALLVVNSQYNWKVKAISSTNTSPDSATWKFTVLAELLPPDITDPDPGQKITAPASFTFKWHRPLSTLSNNPLKYKWILGISSDPPSSSGEVPATTSSDVELPNQQLTRLGSYTFSVKALSADGSGSGQSGEVRFDVVAPIGQFLIFEPNTFNYGNQPGVHTFILKTLPTIGSSPLSGNITTFIQGIFVPFPSNGNRTAEGFSCVSGCTYSFNGQGQQDVIIDFIPPGQIGPVTGFVSTNHGGRIDLSGKGNILLVPVKTSTTTAAPIAPGEVDTHFPTIEVGHTKVPGTEQIIINAGAKDTAGVKKITISLGVGTSEPTALTTETICFNPPSKLQCTTTAASPYDWSIGTKIVYFATVEDIGGNITKSAEQRFTVGKIPDTSTSAPTGIFRVADRAANVAFTALLIAASLFILLAAFQFATGGGNPEQISQARDKLVWAAVGIGVALVAKGVPAILREILLPSGGAPPKITCPPPPSGGIPNPLGAQGCLPGILDSILNVIFTLSLIVVPFVVIYAGFLFVTGGSNPQQIMRARDTLIWTAVGFGVILIAKGLPFILKDILGI